MPANQLAVDGVQSVGDLKEFFLAGHLRIKYGLQQKIAKFFGEVGPVAAINGIQHFIRLFQRVRLNGIERLFAVPGAAIRAAQASHNRNKLLKFISGGEHGVERSI